MSNVFRFLSREERRVIWQYARWLIVGLIVLAFTVWGIRWLLLPTKVLDPEQGLERWRWFYDMHEASSATAGNIENAEKSVARFEESNGDPSTWDWQQRSEHQRLTSVRDGYVTHYNNLASQYNAKMSDMTRNWSAPSDLPRHIANWN